MSKLADKGLLTISGSKAKIIVSIETIAKQLPCSLVPRLWPVLCFLQLFQQVKVPVLWRKLWYNYITTN